MKHLFLITLMLLITLSNGFGQTTKTNKTKQNNNDPAAHSRAEQEIRGILNRWLQIGLSNNIQSIIADYEQNAAKNLIFINADGSVSTFEEILKTLKERKPGELIINSGKFDDVQIRIYGDTAIATYILSSTGQREGKPFSRVVRESVVFTKRNEKWLHVFEQQTNIQPHNQSNGRQTATPNPTEQEVAQLERDWAAAMSRGDIDALNRMLADDAKIAGSKGFSTKAEYIERKTGEIEQAKRGAGKSFETVDSVNVQIYADTAIATGQITWRTEKEGKIETGRDYFTDVAVKRNGRWQFVSMTSMPAKQE